MVKENVCTVEEIISSYLLIRTANGIGISLFITKEIEEMGLNIGDKVKIKYKGDRIHNFNILEMTRGESPGFEHSDRQTTG